MEEKKNNVIPAKGTLITSIIVTIISTVVFAFTASAAFNSLMLKFDKDAGFEALALIVLIPVLVIAGLLLVIFGAIGIVCSIRCITFGYKKTPSIVVLVLNLIYLVVYIAAVAILVLL